MNAENITSFRRLLIAQVCHENNNAAPLDEILVKCLQLYGAQLNPEQVATIISIIQVIREKTKNLSGIEDLSRSYTILLTNLLLIED